MTRSLLLFLSLLFLVPAQTALTAWAESPAKAQWQPIADVVYEQESGKQIISEKPVFALAAMGSLIYAGFGDGVKQLAVNGQFGELADSPQEYVLRMRGIDNVLWVMTKNALHRFTDGKWTQIAEGEFADVCLFNGDLIAAKDNRLYRLAADQLEPWSPEDPAVGQIGTLAVHAETLYCMGLDRVFLYDGQKFVTKGNDLLEFGSLPSKDLRGMISMGNRLVVAHHVGLSLLRGTAATSILGADGLPYDQCTCITKGFDKDFWVGTTKGVIRCTGNEFHYFLGTRWLPDDHVNAIAVQGKSVYVATDKGVGVVEYEPFTLLKKADYYERHLEEWGQKRMAFVHTIHWNNRDKCWLREVSDNDVGWSTHYWAAQAFKYATTGDKQAKQNAVDGFNAMKWSEEVSGIPGFPARGVWAVGETGIKTAGGSGGYPAEWNPTPDGRWEWKGDTSSDETDAQFYYAWIFFKLVADDHLKEKVREHVSRIMDHIIEHGWILADTDKNPTVWARWDPDYFNGKGAYARGLNGLEILTYLRVTYAITGNTKYFDAYQDLLKKGYADAVITQKKTTPIYIFHSDDRLAFYNYYTMLQLEDDPYLRSVYQRSIERSWEIERIEHVPWFNFIYGAVTGNECETEPAVRHLREWPLDLHLFGYDQSHRLDIHPPEGYLPYCRVERALSPRETNGQRWSHNQGVIKTRGRGFSVLEPSAWLDAYWMGRYYGMILPPDTKDPALTSVPRRGLQLGAAPYDGPPMPNVLE